MDTQDIWKLHANDIKFFILSKVKNDVIADDLVQETFIKVHTKLNTLKDENKMKSWLFTIARNTVLDYFKSKKMVYNITDEDFIFEEQKLEHSEIDCLRGIVKSLPKKYRDPLFLSDIKGMKQIQISKQLSLPHATVKSQIQRGRKMIAQGFVDCCDYVINDKGYLVGEIKDKADCKMCH